MNLLEQHATPLDDLLGDSQVRGHMKRMYRIGTKLLQESAFAVYETGNEDATYEVSDLLVPNVSRGDFERSMRESLQVDVAPLVEKKAEDTEDDTPDVDERGVVDYSWLDEATRQRIVRTLSFPQATLSERIQAANNITLAKYYKKRDDERVRNDISLLVHNHPQYPNWIESKDKLLVPSDDDVNGHHWTASRQLGRFVSGIVGSDGENHGLLLYQSDPSQSAHPSVYEAYAGDTINPKAKLGALALSGFPYVVLDLTTSGALTKAARKDLKEFDQKFSTPLTPVSEAV